MPTLSALCYIGGYSAGLLAFAWMAMRRNISPDRAASALLVIMAGGMGGAYLSQWLATGAAGKSVLGGIVGGYLAILLYKRLTHWKRPLGDLCAVGISAGETVGRWGCFFGGCCYGRESGAFCAVYQHDAWRHPAQIYLSLSNLVILCVLIALERKRCLPENGLFYAQGVLYCVARFGIEFWREAPVLPIGLTAAQIACVAGFLFFGAQWRGMQRLRNRELQT